MQYADPFVPSLAVLGRRLEAAPITAELLRWADAALILTDHREFDYKQVVAEAPLIVDTRNATREHTAVDGRIVRL